MNNKKSLIIFCLLLSILFVFNNCGKTSTDREWENTLKGYWIPFDENDNRYDYMPQYIFSDNNRGASFLRNDYESRDSFGWEIKRKQLKTFYDKAPGYNVGHDKYNSQGLYKIKSVSDSRISVIQLTFGGYQREYFLKRGNLSDLEGDE